MKNIALGIVIGFVLSLGMNVYAASTDRSMEYILNRVFNSSTNQIKMTIS